MSKRQKTTKSHTKLKRVLLVIGLMLATVVVVGALYIYLNLRTLPAVDSQYLETYDTTKIVDADNKVIWQPSDKRVTTMKASEIPDLYGKALVAVEDEDFWTSRGYSPKGIANMVVSVVASKINPNIVARGGSTLEQQLIKNVYFDGGHNMSTTTRKIQEIFLASQLDHNFSKEQILAFYANNLSYAEGDTGAAAIMMTYFGKSPSDYQKKTTQNIAQQAYLAGLGQNPTIYNLYTEPKNATKRMQTVLTVMKAKGIITKAQYNKAVDYDLTKDLKPRFWESKQQLALNLKYNSYTDEVQKQLSDLGYNTKDVSLTVHTFMNQKDYDNITATVRNNKYYQDGAVGKEEVGATIIDNDGIVRGMVGSRGTTSEINRATQHTRSSGSSAKPFTAYGPLLQYLGKSYNTASTFDSSAYLYPGTNKYMKNYGGFSYGTVTAQYALRQSLNTVVARIDDQILGTNRIKAFLHGVQLDNKESYSAIDGIGLYVSTLDEAAAYNAINNGGIYTKPRFIDSLTFTDGSTKVIKPERSRVMNASTAWVLTQMMRGVVTSSGTGAAGAIPAYAGYAGKTGTVGLDNASTATPTYGTGGSDSWFSTITNGGYAVSVWFGYDEPNKSPQVSDNFEGPKILGRDLQKQLLKNKAVANWSKPANVKSLGGYGLNANYAITDSKDINQATNTELPAPSANYQRIGKLTDASAMVKSDAAWKTQIPADQKDFYLLYDQDNTILDNPKVIDSSVYDLLKGDK